MLISQAPETRLQGDLLNGGEKTANADMMTRK
jgi:hypothetical protein